MKSNLAGKLQNHRIVEAGRSTQAWSPTAAWPGPQPGIF